MDWKFISKHPDKLTMAFVEKYQDEICWKTYLESMQHIPDDVIEKFCEHISIGLLLELLIEKPDVDSADAFRYIKNRYNKLVDAKKINDNASKK